MSDEWYTPLHIFEALGLEFDLDPCCPITGSVVPAKQTYSLPFDGLTAPWFGLVWMNPPYSKPGPWVEKWLEHGNGVALVPMSKSRWFHKLWNAETAVINLEPNLKFMRPDGPDKQIFLGFILAAVGEIGYQALYRSNLGKVR
jgi:hypothetical protein